MATRNNGKENDNQQEVPANSSGLKAYQKAALRISSSYPLGAPRVDQGPTDFGIISKDARVSPVAGIFACDFAPTMGVSRDVSSPLNRAMNVQFNEIRSQISGNRPYESADHMLYRMACDGLYDLYDVIARNYKIIKKYEATNLYFPRDLLYTMGFNVDDWISNAAEIYQWLVNSAAILKPFPTLKIGDATDRRRVFNSYIFRDGDISSTQTYVFTQKWFWSYERVDQVKGLTLRQLPETWGATKALFDSMYNAMIGSTDCHIIAADIRRAYPDKLRDLMVPPEAGAEVDIEKVDSVLSSIMNAVIVNPVMFGADKVATVINDLFRIRDAGGNALITTSTHTGPLVNHINTAALMIAAGEHINVLKAEPTEEDILDCTRLKPGVLVNYRTDGATVTITSCATEVITGARLFRKGMGTAQDLSSAIMLCCNDVDPSSMQFYDALAMFEILGDLANFDWHPPIYVGGLYCSNTGVLNTSPQVGEVADIQNYVPLPGTVLDNIHTTTILASLDVG